MLPKRCYLGILVMVLAIMFALTNVSLAAAMQNECMERAELCKDFVAKLSVNLGVDQEKVDAALKTTKKQMLDEAVKEGRLTKEQAEKIADNPSPCWLGNLQREYGFKEGRLKHNEDIAKALGITQEQLKSELQSGKKLPQIIADHGLTFEQFHQKMLAIKKENLSREVSEGKLSQEKADKILKKIEQRLNNRYPKAGN